MLVDFNGIAAYGPKVLVMLSIVLIGIALYLVANRFLVFLHRNQLISDPIFHVVKNLCRWFIFAMILLFTLQQLGVKISSIINSFLALAAMVAMGFVAVWSVFSNFFCSFLVVIFSPFRIGDEIEISEVVGGEGLRGKVVDFNIMYTSILESGDIPEDEKALIRIPNNVFFQKATKRWKGDVRQSVEKYLFKKSISGSNVTSLKGSQNGTKN